MVNIASLKNIKSIGKIDDIKPVKPVNPSVSSGISLSDDFYTPAYTKSVTKADDTKPLTSAEALGQTYKKGVTEKRISDRTAASKNKFNNDFIAKAIEAMDKPQVINRWKPELQQKYFNLTDDWKKISNKDTYFDRGYVMSKLLEHDYATGRSAIANMDKAVRRKHKLDPDNYDDLLDPTR